MGGLTLAPETRRWLGVALGLHLLAAWFSAGFYHPDEHFQILEFIGARLGLSPASDLPIEYHRMIRPWLQPAVYGLLIQGLSAVGLTNPFTWAFAARLLSALLGWGSLVAMMVCLPRWVEAARERRWAAMGCALLWYLPSLHARHSSENLAGSVFLIGLAVLVTSARYRDEGSFRDAARVVAVPGGAAFGAGLLLGASFELRYQVGFMVLGAGLWWCLVARTPWRALGSIAAGILAAIAAGSAVDRWGYGTWTFAPWNYLNFNLIENHVHDTDTNPVWDLFRRATTETWPPLGILALVLFGIAWIRRPRHLLTWSLVPLFLVHHAIGHKELRFLFPLAHAGPVLLAMALAGLELSSGVLGKLGRFLVGWNGIALVAQTLLPAWGPIRLQEYLHGRAAGTEVPLYLLGEGPYYILGQVSHFYRPPGIIERHVSTPAELAAARGRGLILVNGFRLPEGSGLGELCPALYRTLPLFLDRPGLKNRLENVKNWTVFDCSR